LNGRLARLLSRSKRAYEDLERLQAQMAQSERLASIGRLVSGAAHELNNPLTAILGYSELIARNEELPAASRSFAQKIMHQARRTKSLVESLLSFAGQRSSSKHLTDLNTLVNKLSQLHLVEIPPTVSLTRDLQPDLPPVMGDDSQLLQVVLHVVNNAIDAVGETGGEILVRTHAQDDRVILEVCDNGPGIAEPSRVFDPFYTTKPVGHGTGLGLSACYGIIQEHDGTIECLNVAPKGAMFRITLRAAVKDAVKDAVSAQDSALSR
jgi:two-component system NtrC family sensor kinase